MTADEIDVLVERIGKLETRIQDLESQITHPTAAIEARNKAVEDRIAWLVEKQRTREGVKVMSGA